MKNKIEMITDAEKKGIPTFTLKATDKHSVKALEQYISNIVRDKNITLEFKEEIIQIYEEFIQYQTEKRPYIKSPD